MKLTNLKTVLYWTASGITVLLVATSLAIYGIYQKKNAELIIPPDQSTESILPEATTPTTTPPTIQTEVDQKSQSNFVQAPTHLDWLTFNETNYKFQFKYPKRFELNKNNTNVGFPSLNLESGSHSLISLIDRSTITPNSDAPFDWFGVTYFTNSSKLTAPRLRQSYLDATIQSINSSDNSAWDAEMKANFKPIPSEITLPSTTAYFLSKLSGDLTVVFVPIPQSDDILIFTVLHKDKSQPLSFTELPDILASLTFN